MPIYKRSLDYHQKKPYGKLCIAATKPLMDQADLSLAYSPGVAGPCEVIAKDPDQADYLTSKGNLIAVISNGTAVLGLGNIGALAAKPVMEGKAVLFKKFANIDAFDIEINETDPDKLIEIIAALEPTFGGINLEDIKSPECFYIESELKKRLKIPVIHDDQHGTAIVVAAGLENALSLANKKIEDITLVCNGAGAAAIACVNLLCVLGLKKENVYMLDRQGVISRLREASLDDVKKNYMQDTPFTTLAEVMKNADVFLGLSSAGVVSKEMVASMAPNPIIFALANPEPEISPDLVRQVRQDAIIATGRSDFSNQVNNALCYPYLFRGALDVGATTINEQMKVACVRAIAKLARATVTDIVTNAYGGVQHTFGPDYIIPKPFDKRLYVDVSLAVAIAAMETGVARRPIADFKAYEQELESFIYQSFEVMRPVFNSVRHNKGHKKGPIRLAFSEGEEPRILQACQQLRDEKIAFPILIGRPDIIERRIQSLSLPLQRDVDYEVVDPGQDERFYDYWTHFHKLTGRDGISVSIAKNLLRTNTTIIAGMMVKRGDADGMICGTIGRYHDHLSYIEKILDCKEGVRRCSSVSAILMDTGPLFITDPFVIKDPDQDDLVEMTCLSIETMLKFSLTPKVAFVSHSNFGTCPTPDAIKMRNACRIVQSLYPHLQIDGEMQAEAAILPHIRSQAVSESVLTDTANLLVMPNIDAANITYTLLKALDKKLGLGPILLGLSDIAYIASHTISVRGIVNLASLATLDALSKESK
ncbi:MAG: NADP-dependent malic enzyme [Holosporales bacterium]